MEVIQADGSTIELGLGDAGVGCTGHRATAALRVEWIGRRLLVSFAHRPRDRRRAWQRELDASGDREARFFHFIWDGGVWMAYGLADGEVRGVYCPSHNSQRAERSRAALCSAADVVLELPLAA